MNNNWDKMDLGSYAWIKVAFQTIKFGQNFDSKHSDSFEKATSDSETVIFSFKNGEDKDGCSRSSELHIRCGMKYALTSGQEIVVDCFIKDTVRLSEKTLIFTE